MIYKILFFILSLFFLIRSTFSLCIPSSTQCGCSSVKPLLSAPKIVGGYTALTNSWPWIVSLRQVIANTSLKSPGFAFCGGTLISDKYVLTAAHCFYGVQTSDISNYFAVVGAQYINDTNPVRYTIKSVIIHEKYNSTTYENDITLLELAYKVNFNNSKVGFICLPPGNISTYPPTSMNATAIGWGLLTEGGSASYTLQQVQLPIISDTNKYCSNVVNNDLLQFCAGFIQGGKDTCQGDSGGPLMVYNSTSDTWNIAGVTSFGYGCAEPQYPGAYTRVSMFVDWINAHTNNSSSVSQASIKPILDSILLLLSYISLFLQRMNYFH